MINKDTALAASILKTINSPFYGLNKKAKTVQEALSLLRLRETTRLISGLLLRRAFASCDSPAMQEYWDTSSRVAMLSAYLGRELAVAALDEAHKFGLFRDCGIPALLSRHPQYTRVVGDPVRSAGRDIAEIECEHFGIDHATLGATLARSAGTTTSRSGCRSHGTATIRSFPTYPCPSLRRGSSLWDCLRTAPTALSDPAGWPRPAWRRFRKPVARQKRR